MKPMECRADRGTWVWRSVCWTTATMALVVVAAALAVLARYESSIFPVLQSFEIKKIDENKDTVAFVGHVMKRRSCEFLSTEFLLGDPWEPARPRERLTIWHPWDYASQTLEVGRQQIGPFHVARPITQAGPLAFLRVRHRCHPFWVTETLAVVGLRRTVFALRPGEKPPALVPTPD